MIFCASSCAIIVSSPFWSHQHWHNQRTPGYGVSTLLISSRPALVAHASRADGMGRSSLGEFTLFFFGLVSQTFARTAAFATPCALFNALISFAKSSAPVAWLSSSRACHPPFALQ